MTRKAALYLETLYNVINLVFAWFGLANYYIFFIIITQSLEDVSTIQAPAVGVRLKLPPTARLRHQARGDPQHVYELHLLWHTSSHILAFNGQQACRREVEVHVR